MMCENLGVKFTNEFQKVSGAKFALYGAGLVGGVGCYEYMEKLGLEDQIVCFVDGDKAKHGKSLCGKEIRSIEFLRRNPDVTVIISSGYFAGIYEDIRNVCGTVNKIYAHVPADCPYGEEEFIADSEMIESFYDIDDEYSRTVIRSLVYLRDTTNIRIQPAENVLALTAVSSYWYDDKTDLKRYDELTICDAGAFDGDTLKQLYECYGGRIKKYHAFEPDEKAASGLKRVAGALNITDIVEIHTAGLSDENATLRFSASGQFAQAHHLSEDGEDCVSVRRVDDMNLSVIGKACIKMDIEGFEMAALGGARNFIERYEPELAICVYHRANDIFKIPEYIKSINPSYKCILRGGNHMVCYASIPQ
jgi:FkbM family methyltransferase